MRCYAIKNEVIVKNRDDSTEFTVQLSQKLAQTVNIYCETIEINPEKFIRDAIVKDLSRTYVELQSEDYLFK